MVRSHEAVHVCSLPAEFYTSPAVLRRERAAIFGRQWTYAGALSQIAQPGDYIVTETARDSVLVLRNGRGELRAFANVCRHRGYPVCRHARGNATRLECPFHGWTYDLDGRLVSAAGLAELTDAGGLQALNVAAWRGLVFVAFDRPPEPLATTLSGSGEPFDATGMSLVGERARDFEANWKLAFEHPLHVDQLERTIQPALTRLRHGGDHLVVTTLRPITPTR